MRITLKKAYRDGTIAVDMDPLSLLCRLATSVPPPRFHTVKYVHGEGTRQKLRPWAVAPRVIRARLSHLPGADEADRAG